MQPEDFQTTGRLLWNGSQTIRGVIRLWCMRCLEDGSMRRCRFFFSIRPGNYAELISAVWMRRRESFCILMGDDVLPEGLLFQIDEKQARSILEAAASPDPSV